MLACHQFCLGSGASICNTETTGGTASFHLKEQFNLTLTFPVRTEGNSVSNLLLKPNLENKRDKQNIFHLTYFGSLNKKCNRCCILKRKTISFALTFTLFHELSIYVYIRSSISFIRQRNTARCFTLKPSSH